MFPMPLLPLPTSCVCSDSGSIYPPTGYFLFDNSHSCRYGLAAFCAVEFEPFFAKEAKKAQLAGQSKGGLVKAGLLQNNSKADSDKNTNTAAATGSDEGTR
jgi:hypothetical protein